MLFALLFLLFLGTFAPIGRKRAEPPPSISLIAFSPLAPSAEQASPGRLRFLAGWTLTSNDPRFGGISAMHVDKDQVRAISDSGWTIDFALAPAGGMRPVRIDRLPGALGGGGKKGSDVEAMVVRGDQLWLGLERRNAVWRLGGSGYRASATQRPELMRRWSENAGVEAMVRLANGHFLLFAEGRGGLTEAVLFLGDPAVSGTPAVPMRYRPPRGYRITDAALLPDGRMLLLHRRFTILEGISARLTVAPPPEAQPGGLILGEEIAAFAPPGPVDNMEALSVTVEQGQTIVWIASDDNYMPLQRTLLLKFAFVA